MSKYSQIKAAWHLDRMNALRQGKNAVPVHVQLVLSDLCNQSCSFCAYRMEAGLSTELFKTPETINPNRRIPTEKAKEIIRDCAGMGVKCIQFTGGGEPTVHKDHLELFGLAQSCGMETALVTNGVKLNASAPEVQAMTWIRVSIDSGTPETYCRVRQVTPMHWDRAWANLEALGKTYQGALGVGYVITPDNFEEIGDCAQKCRQIGVSNMRVGAVFSTDGIAFYGDRIPRIIEAINEAKTRYDGDGFEIIDLFGRRLGDLEHGSPADPLCSYQQMTTYIGGDLNVYRCCNVSYSESGKLGSLKEQSFKQLHENVDFTFDATQCRFCQFIGQNEAINALIRKPEHENFV